MRARNKDEKISLSLGDMFMDKDQWSQVIKEYVIQEGISLRKIKNDSFRHIVRCKNKGYQWRIQVSGPRDGITWHIKSIRGYCKCPRENFTSVASYSSIVVHLVVDYKVNLNIT